MGAMTDRSADMTVDLSTSLAQLWVGGYWRI